MIPSIFHDGTRWRFVVCFRHWWH